MAGSGRISVFASRDLRTLLAALKQVPRDVQKQVRQFTKQDAQPIWQSEIQGNVKTRLDQRVLGSTARVRVSNQNVQLESARIGRSLQGGAKPSAISGGVEFGANRDDRVTYTTTSRRGKRYPVTRRTKRQLPTRNTNGRVVFPASRKSIPRLASLWYQTAFRTLLDTFDKN
ncbi:hypothetical protein EDF52_10285 [Curtobacterium sp. PhB42]|uniref:hypothetical protein n=1 Tax=unclassified Curtobacterium TaxID=257496 RepID=UPI001063997C|nr:MULTISPECIES: hypothetical protein [unclassified Curtobacterium]TDW50997.1 hypothetical protein EDF52_10285 [Curtobacterium sp. PhB42]TDW56157.1 hypothetical protein EDF47_104268 [Curtobacterium sp. PhB190]